METYQEFLDRINSFEKKEARFGNDYFNGNKSIKLKVNADNSFKAFYGDTVVFNLDDRTKERLSGYTDALYEAVPESFCEKLVSDTFHMTLHDLSNSPDLQEIAAEVFKNELLVAENSRKIKRQTIKMSSKYIFNMVNTSLVLGLYPIDEKEYNKLIELYYLFDNVKHLDYPFTPHITLAYYNVNGFNNSSAAKLEEAVYKCNENELEIELDTAHLYYQKFVSMNEYINIINLGM